MQSYCRGSLLGRHCWSQGSQALLDWSWALSHILRSSLHCPRSWTAEEWRPTGNPSGTNCWSSGCNLRGKKWKLCMSSGRHRWWRENFGLWSSPSCCCCCCCYSHLGCSVRAPRCQHLTGRDRNPGPWRCRGLASWAAPAAGCEDGERCREPLRCLRHVWAAYPAGDMTEYRLDVSACAADTGRGLVLHYLDLQSQIETLVLTVNKQYVWEIFSPFRG